MKKKTIALTILSILIFTTLVIIGMSFHHNITFRNNLYKKKYQNPRITQEEINKIKVNSIHWDTLPEDVKLFSKRNGLYDNIFNSDKPTIAYGYEIFGVEPTNLLFHLKMQHELKKIDTDQFNIVPIKDMENEFIKSYNKQKQQNKDTTAEEKSCFSNTLSDQTTYLKFMSYTLTCYFSACLVDSKNNHYIQIPKHTQVISKIIKEYKQ